MNLKIGLLAVAFLKPQLHYDNGVFDKSITVSKQVKAFIDRTCMGSQRGCGEVVLGCYLDMKELRKNCRQSYSGQCSGIKNMTDREMLEDCSDHAVKE